MLKDNLHPCQLRCQNIVGVTGVLLVGLTCTRPLPYSRSSIVTLTLNKNRGGSCSFTNITPWLRFKVSMKRRFTRIVVLAVSLVTLVRSSLSYLRILTRSLLPVPEGYRFWTSITKDLTRIRPGWVVFHSITCCHDVLYYFVKSPVLMKVKNAAINRKEVTPVRQWATTIDK
jgi:hypothetical protein